MAWSIEIKKKITPTKPVLIEGLPGIGNVGKIAVDFLIDELDAQLTAIFTADDSSAMVFVDEDNLLVPPTIEVYYKKHQPHDLLLLAGDLQPQDDASCREFVRAVIEYTKKLGCQMIITTGGIGLPDVPEDPAVFCTGTRRRSVDDFCKGTSVRKDLFGVVGPVIGVTGLLAVAAERHNMTGLCLLAETLGNPVFIGIDGSKKILEVLKKRFTLSFSVAHIDKDIKAIEDEVAERIKHLPQIKEREEGMRYIG